MILYQQKTLADQPIGEPGPLPPELDGLADESLADLSWVDPALGYGDRKFVPVVVSDPDPEPRRLGRIYFLQRIAPATRIAIRTAAKTDPVVEDFLDILSATDTVELDQPDTVAGVNYLVSQGLMTQDEANPLLA